MADERENYLPTVLPLPLLSVTERSLAQLYRPSRLLQFLLHFLCFSFRHPFLNRLGRAIDKIFSFLQTQRGEFAHDFNYLDFLLSGTRQDDIELIFFRRRRWLSCSRSCPCAGNNYWGSRTHSPVFFELFHEISDFQNREFR